MQRLTNESMAKHTTFRIGGPVEEMLIPETEEELISIFGECVKSGNAFRLLGRGSNILVSDAGLKGRVIDNARACTRLEIADGVVYAGGSVKIQQFIRFCVRNNLAAPEYLFSVPATIGGTIFMNAGRGRSFNKQISDSLESVRVYDGTKDRIFLMKKSECGFEYRHSIFHNHRDWLILGAYFKPEAQEAGVGEAGIKDRMEYVKELQDYNYPTAGSVFKVGDYRILKAVRGMGWGGAEYSSKTTNWINNTNNAKARDVERLIWFVQALHLLRLRRAVREIEIWK